MAQSNMTAVPQMWDVSFEVAEGERSNNTKCEDVDQEELLNTALTITRSLLFLKYNPVSGCLELHRVNFYCIV